MEDFRGFSSGQREREKSIINKQEPFYTGFLSLLRKATNTPPIVSLKGLATKVLSDSEYWYLLSLLEFNLLFGPFPRWVVEFR